MKPTKNRLLVKVEVEKLKKGEQPTAGGMMKAKVLKTGNDVRDIVIGDKVVFAPYGINEVTVGKDKLIIVDEELILAVYEQGK